VLCPIELLGLAGEPLLSDLLLDGVELADEIERAGRRLGLGALGLEEISPGVRLISPS